VDDRGGGPEKSSKEHSVEDQSRWGGGIGKNFKDFRKCFLVYANDGQSWNADGIR